MVLVGTKVCRHLSRTGRGHELANNFLFRYGTTYKILQQHDYDTLR